MSGESGLSSQTFKMFQLVLKREFVFEKNRCLCDVTIGTIFFYQPQELQLCFSLMEEKNSS